MEMIDIYNENKEFTGLVQDRAQKLTKGQYMMYVLALIERPDHTYLITQRSMNKKWAAGAFEVPGGGAKSKETSFEAVCREVKEEVGLDVSGQKVLPIYTYFNEDLERGDNYFVDIYHFYMDITEEDVHLQESEAIDFKFASEEQIGVYAELGMFLHFKRLGEALQAETENKS